MGGEWRRHEWGEIVALEYGKSLRDYRSESGRYRVYGTNGPIGWHEEPLCTHPGVIVGRKGAYRGIHYSTGPFFAIDTAFYLEPKEEMDLRWAYYCLLTYDINGMDSGSAIPSTSREAFYRLPVSVPPLPEQRAIACILGTLDDKIELNRKMSRTLEEMARAIFKSWFVDFDPVRAKAAVRRAHPDWTNAQISRAACPKLKPEIAELFPDSFEDSELGQIPKGWRVGKLAEVCEKPQYGFTASSNNKPIGPRFLRITDINKADWIDWATVPYCLMESSQYPKYALRRGDIVIARMADPGHGALIEEHVNAVFASYLIRFRPRAVMFQRYLQYWLRSDFYWQLVKSRQSGTTRANLNAQVLGTFAILLPPSGLLVEFTRIAEALRNDLVVNVHQSNTLAALRDTLLPKLISGELRIKDAERFLGRML